MDEIRNWALQLRAPCQETQEKAAKQLLEAAHKGEDIGAAERAILTLPEPSMDDRSADLYKDKRSIVQEALLLHYLHTRNRDGLHFFLMYAAGRRTHFWSAYFLSEWARTEQWDITPAVPVLEKCLEYLVADTHWPSALALGFYALHRADLQLQDTLQNHAHGDVRDGFQYILDHDPFQQFKSEEYDAWFLGHFTLCDPVNGIIPLSTSVGQLDRLERGLEISFSQRQKKQIGRPREPHRLFTEVETNWRFIEVLRQIAERKAKLTKECDGELLAGETLPPTTRRHAIYSLRQRGRSHV